MPLAADGFNTRQCPTIKDTRDLLPGFYCHPLRRARIEQSAPESWPAHAQPVTARRQIAIIEINQCPAATRARIQFSYARASCRQRAQQSQPLQECQCWRLQQQPSTQGPRLRRALMNLHRMPVRCQNGSSSEPRKTGAHNTYFHSIPPNCLPLTGRAKIPVAVLSRRRGAKKGQRRGQ